MVLLLLRKLVNEAAGGMKSIQKTKKLWAIGTIVVILFVSSFSTIINNSMLPISKALAAFGVEDNQNEESAYLKFAAQTIKASNSNSTTVQLPEAAKGPTIPSKGYLVQQIRIG